MTELTKDFIVEKMNTNVNWLYRGILAIYEYQTREEQQAEETKFNNGVGFNGVDGHIMSSFAKQLGWRKYLTEKQIFRARKIMKKYAGQLLRIAESKK